MTARLRASLLPIACIAVSMGLAMVAAPAGASFGIKSFEASYNEAPLAGAAAEALGPPDFQAGSHPYQFTATVAFNTVKNAEGEEVVDDYAKEVQFKLPRGVVGNIAGIPQCPQATFMGYGIFGGGAKCPASTQVGVITVGSEKLPLFNLTPPGGVSGRIGAIAFLAPLVIDLAIRSGSDYGLTAELHNLSQVKEAKKISLTLWGVPADSRHDEQRCLGREEPEERTTCPSGARPEALLTMPTSCKEPLTTTIAAQPWNDPATSAEASVTASGAGGESGELVGCEGLHFDPSVAVRTELATADTPSGLTVDVRVPFQGGTGELAAASLKNLVVALPEGLSLNPATSAGLIGCTPAQFGLGQASVANCPNSSKLGTLEIQTPILSKALTGFVYLKQPPEGLFDGNLTIYLAGDQAGLDFKLEGQLSAQPDSGQLTLTLDEVPELPLSELRLDLLGGPRGAIANPAACATITTTAELTPYSTDDATTRSSADAIDENCAGGFAPAFRAGATSSTAGQGTGFAIGTSRSDGQQYLRDLTVAMPPGVMANISSVPQCGDAEAAAGTCPASSEVGTVTVGAGAGSDPFYLNGRIYLTGPYAGAPFGISLVIPALAGPFNLGTVIVRGRITVDLATSSMTIATDSFPTILRGIPLRIKNIALAIDRSGFMVNPTNCAPQTTDGTIGSTAGGSAAVSAPFGIQGCAGLLFSPNLVASTLGKASSRGEGASLNVKVNDPPSTHANLKVLSIKLPKALKPRLTSIQQACLAATFAVNPQACSPASVVGNAAVDTPLLNVALTGPVYLVFHRGAKFPDIVMVLQGNGLQLQLKGTVEVTKGISTTTFDPLPDIPMSLFELNLPEGSHSLLGATEDLCAKRRNMVNTMGGQNGAQKKSTVKTAVEGCKAHVARSARRKRGKASATHSTRRAKKRGNRR